MGTPQYKAENLSAKLGIDVYLKREDKHDFGSHKGRSIPLMIDKHHQDGWCNFVISSSGNAALAAIAGVEENENINLTIFVGKNIYSEKFDVLLSRSGTAKNITIAQVEKPKQRAFQMSKKDEAKYLRQSTDDTALIGYHELASELADIKDLQAVFVPTSSGTTAQGIHEGMKKIDLNPQIHIVQTTTCHPFIDDSIIAEDKSLANAIVDRVGHRKTAIAKVLNESHGQGWIATNAEIKQAIKLLNETESIKISPNSALSIVGLQKAIKNNQLNGPVVCLITGK